MLLAVLFTFGKLNHNNEIIAMRSAGLNIFQITRTLIIFGIILSIGIFWVNDRLLPRSLVLVERIKTQMESDTKKIQPDEHKVFSNLSMYGLKNRLFFVNKFSLTANTMENIVVLEHDEKQNIIKKIVANKGVYQNDIWRFYDCITYNFDENGQIKEDPRYQKEEIMDIPEAPREFLDQRQRPDCMTIAQLTDYSWKLSKSGATTVIRNLKIDLYKKFTTPLTSIIIILLGIPFALKMKKRATGLSSIGIAIMVGFLYFVLNAITEAMGRVGYLTPFLAVSLSHIIALTTALYLIHSLP